MPKGGDDEIGGTMFQPQLIDVTARMPALTESGSVCTVGCNVSPVDIRQSIAVRGGNRVSRRPYRSRAVRTRFELSYADANIGPRCEASAMQE